MARPSIRHRRLRNGTPPCRCSVPRSQAAQSESRRKTPKIIRSRKTHRLLNLAAPLSGPPISVLSFTRKTLKTVVCFISTFVLHGLSKRLYRPVSRKVMNYRQILKSSFDQAISPSTDTRPFPGSSAFWVGFPPTYFSSSSSWPNPRSYVSANSLPLAHNSLIRGSYFYSLFQAGAHGVWVPTAQGPALGHWQGLGTGCE